MMELPADGIAVPRSIFDASQWRAVMSENITIAEEHSAAPCVNVA